MKISGFGIPPEDGPIGKPFGESNRYDGLGVSPGIVIGPVYLVERGAVNVPEYLIQDDDIAAESERFKSAIEKAKDQLEALKTAVESEAGAAAEDLAGLLDAHIHMLSGSRLVRGVEARIQERHLNAEAAVQAVISDIADQYRKIDDTYLAGRIHDIEEVGMRLIRNLTKSGERSFSNLPNGCIIVADEITPSDTALMDPDRIGGFASAMGGAEGHTAIMARSLGIPAILGTADLLAEANTGDLAILDGQTGTFILHPTQAEIDEYQKKSEALKVEYQVLSRLRDLPSETRDGLLVSLKANIELPVEVDPAKNAGAQGIGLVRSEFMFMNRNDLPNEDEQYEVLRTIVQEMDGEPVTLRTLDVGGDKIAVAFGPEQESASTNPALGLRAIRFSLRHPTLFKIQIAAFLRAGAHGPIRILLPMISTVAEVKTARALIISVAEELRAKGVTICDPLPPIGVMIEVPAAALSSDSLARHSDFFSIGTNDLTMYTLAIDRANEEVARLYDSLNPSVLRLIQFTANAAEQAQIPINICGEMAGDERLTALLIGLGFRDLSMSSASIPRVKRRIRSLDSVSGKRCADMIMLQADPARIAMMIDDFNELAE